MISLMIVDDEVNIREGLRDCVDWQSHGITIACEAEDGRSALEQFDRLKPDLVLTDVVMPNFDGIALVEAIRRRDRHTGVIFLSAHQDIEYLKSAFRYEAIDYLLKPINVEELTFVVGRAAERIREHSERDIEVRRLRDLVQEHRSGLRERLFRRILQGYLTDEKDVAAAADRAGVGQQVAACHTVAVIHCNAGPETHTIIETVAPTEITVIDGGEDQLILVAPWKDGGPDGPVEGACRRIGKRLSRAGIRSSIGVGTTVRHLRKLRDSYTTARMAVSRAFFEESSTVVRYTSLRARRTPLRVSSDVDALLRDVMNRREPAVAEAVSRLFDLARNQSWSREALLGICTDVLMRAYEFVVRRVEPDILGALAPDYAALFAAKSLSDLQESVTSSLGRWIDALSNPRDHRSVVQEALLYIEANYYHDFSVPDVAESVLLSPSYLSSVFHEETGQTIHEYVTELRMGKATELLRTTTYRVSDIAHAVGYQDGNYFSRCFKKQYGVSPGEYRENPWPTGT